MKPKSFKSTQEPLGHYIFNVEDIVIKGDRIEINRIVVEDHSGEVILQKDQSLAVLLDSDNPVSGLVFGRVARVDNTSGRVRLMLEEHKRSSEFQWTMFLQKLKKECGSGDHNKKQRVLHVIKMQERVENLPASIKLKVQIYPDTAYRGNDKDKFLYEIQERLSYDSKLPLEELSDLISSVTLQASITVNEAKYSRRLRGYNVTTSIATEFPLSISKSLSDNFKINIPRSPIGQQLLATMRFDTENNTTQQIVLDEALDEMSPDTDGDWYALSIYDFETNTYLCHQEKIKKIETSQSGGYYGIELSDEITASFLREQEIKQSLCIFHQYKPLPIDEDVPFDEGFDEQFDEQFEPTEPTDQDHRQQLEFNYDAYEIKEDDAVAGKKYLRVKVDNRKQLEVLREIETVSVMVNGIDGIDGIDFMTIEGVTWNNELNHGLLDLRVFDHNIFLDKVEAHQDQPKLVIKGAQHAIAQDSALMLTFWPTERPISSPEQLIPDLTKYLEGGKRIIEDVGAWLEQRSVALDVVDAEHVPQMAIMRTKSSATPGVSFEISSSKDEMYTYYDVGGMDFDELETRVYTSEFLERLTRRFESISNVNLVLHLEEIKQKQIELTQRQLMSVYNSVEKHLVCSNEKIHKIMRKKKYGKCIYRIVVKHGVAARQIAYGKYQNCTLYLDNIQPWN